MEESLARQLRELDSERLVELISSLYGRDAAIDRQIAAFAARPLPSRHEAEIRSWLRELTASRRRRSRYGGGPPEAEVDRILGEIGALIGRGDPATTLGLVEEVLVAGSRLVEMVDDSDARISTELQELGPLWLKAARHCRDAGIERDWLAAMEGLLEKDGYGLLDELLPNAGLLLAEEELRRLAERYEARAAREEEPYRRRHWLNRAGALARPLRDPRLFLRAERLIEPDFNGPQLEAIAKCFLELGDPQGALEWLETPWPGVGWGQNHLLAKAYEALGRTEDQIAVVRTVWQKSSTVGNLEDLLALLSPEEQEKVKEEAREKAAGIPNLEDALELLIFLGRHGEAGELCIARRGELNGFNYYRLKELADQLAAHGQPLAASLILRSLLGEILNEGNSRAYHHAADYYEQLGSLSGRIGDWSGEPDHEAYRGDLRYEHGRKYAFWSRVKG